MVMRMISCLSILFILFMFANATNRASMIEGLPTDSTCDSCLEASRKAKNTLNNLVVFENLDKFSSVCQILPNDALEFQCLDNLRAHLHQTILSFQELVHENSICNGIGLCAGESVIAINNDIVKEERASMKLQGKRACTRCHKVARHVITTFGQLKMKKKVMEVLLESCEEIPENGRQCKQAVYEFAGQAFSKLIEMQPSNACDMLDMCEEEEPAI